MVKKKDDLMERLMTPVNLIVALIGLVVLLGGFMLKFYDKADKSELKSQAKVLQLLDKSIGKTNIHQGYIKADIARQSKRIDRIERKVQK